MTTSANLIPSTSVHFSVDGNRHRGGSFSSAFKHNWVVIKGCPGLGWHQGWEERAKLRPTVRDCWSSLSKKPSTPQPILLKCSLYHLLLANSLLRHNVFTNTKPFTWHQQTNGLILIIWWFITDSYIFCTFWVTDSFVFHKVRKHILNKTNEVWKALSTHRKRSL